MEPIKKRAESMLQTCKVIVLSSITKEGYPRPVPVIQLKSNGISTVWIATGSKSQKTKDFRLNPKAGLCFYERGNSVALTGEIEIVKDSAEKKELWQDWLIDHFSKGVTDPDYCLLKFRTDAATLWIDQQFVHRKIK